MDMGNIRTIIDILLPISFVIAPVIAIYFLVVVKNLK